MGLADDGRFAHDPTLPAPTNRRDLPTFRDHPVGWGNAGHRDHLLGNLRTIAFLQGAELMGRPAGRHAVTEDLDAAHRDLRAVRTELDDAHETLATTRGALEVTRDELAATRDRDRARAQLAANLRPQIEALLDDAVLASSTTAPIPRQRAAS